METRRMEPPLGLYFEEFALGDGCESVGRTVTEVDIVNFAALSGDWNRIHTDAHYARGEMFGERVAHGLLVLSIASGLAVRMGFMEGTVKAFMQLEWQFRRPVLIGDTLRLRATVREKKPLRRMGGGVVTFRMEVLNQRDEVCQRGSWDILCKLRPHESEEEE